MSDQSGSEERFYGPLGEVTKVIKTVVSDQTPLEPEIYTSEFTYDTWNRLQSLIYPDGEQLSYRYDAGGRVNKAVGKKGNYTYKYINRLEYDEFEQRAFVELGNNVRSTYSYNALNRRLATLKSRKGSGNPFQDLSYGYDRVGNILSLDNLAAVTAANQLGGEAHQSFSYDDFYRLTGASGTLNIEPDKQHRYNLTMKYDTHSRRSCASLRPRH